MHGCGIAAKSRKLPIGQFILSRPIQYWALSHQAQESVAGTAAPMVIGDKWHQGQMSGPLNGGSQCPLVFGADSGPSSGLNLGPV